jgi:hypothetical protein
MIRRFAFLFAMLCLCAVLGLGQMSTVVSAQGAAARTAGGFSGSFTTSTMQYNSPGITGAPYSAEEVNERVQTLADGTHITQTGPSQRMWRDSQGRTRTERQMGGFLNANAPKTPAIVEIRDPVAGCAYILDAQGKVAHRVTLQPMPGRAARPAMAPVPAPAARTAPVPAPAVRLAPPADPNRPQFQTEPLGSQLIEGLMAEGMRTTTTYPVGFQGNDRPIVSITENWRSTDLRLTVLSKTSDPRQGENTTKLTNISRTEPDPLLFMPPLDYSVVEETGPQVTIHYTAQ